MSWEVYETGGTPPDPLLNYEDETIEPSWCRIECLCYRCTTECDDDCKRCCADAGDEVLKCERFTP